MQSINYQTLTSVGRHIIHYMRDHTPQIYWQLRRAGTLYNTVYEIEQAACEEMSSKKDRLGRRGLRMQIKDKLELYNYGQNAEYTAWGEVEKKILPHNEGNFYGKGVL